MCFSHRPHCIPCYIVNGSVQRSCTCSPNSPTVCIEDSVTLVRTCRNRYSHHVSARAGNSPSYCIHSLNLDARQYFPYLGVTSPPTNGSRMDLLLLSGDFCYACRIPGRHEGMWMVRDYRFAAESMLWVVPPLSFRWPLRRCAEHGTACMTFFSPPDLVGFAGVEHDYFSGCRGRRSGGTT